MYKYCKHVLVIVAILFFSISCMPGQAPRAESRRMASDFTLADIEGNRTTLKDYKDKSPVLLIFWTTWCPFCRKELKSLNDRYPSLKSKGLEVFAVDAGEPSYKVENFIKSNNFSFRVLLDKDTEVAQAYEVFGVPSYVLVDKSGYIVFNGNGYPEKQVDSL